MPMASLAKFSHVTQIILNISSCDRPQIILNMSSCYQSFDLQFYKDLTTKNDFFSSRHGPSLII